MARGNTRMEILVFSAVRNIKRGEELTTLYQAPLGATLARRKFLSSKYGFICMFRACINNKVLNLHSESLKYAPWIVAKESGSEILNKPTLEEIQTLKQVEGWYESVSQAAGKAGQLHIFDDFLRKNNPHGLSDEVVSAYQHRANVATFRAAKQVFDNMGREMGIFSEDF
ncbi:uncharacterized protein EAE97_010824 [Botrytis byssoidea]|uniref:SET domain-containing protein n=1 Tax=Botrytis byssoidea TaxID=139641 RepID=A0A9P5LM24_9HELO|nr:uncharacterized protein EAE97_010824 [Botrytis byssoidea]KAF7923386.1 hypothetical protein EAE97_010824 [Botrytis byssoidea]